MSKVFKIWHVASGKWVLWKIGSTDVKLAEFSTEAEALEGLQRCITKKIKFYDEAGKEVK